MAAVDGLSKLADRAIVDDELRHTIDHAARGH
jgi:hypothetical protein